MADATTYRYRVQVTDVHDGDTITVVVDLGFWITHTTPVRLARINAPELNTDAGKAARQALAGYIAAHPGQWSVQTFRSGKDKYGRWLANVLDPSGACVNDWLVANGFAVPFMTTPATPHTTGATADGAPELVMPFVTVASTGGPHDDAGYAAGWEMGALDAELRHSRPADLRRTVHSANIPQADLVAMNHGYIATAQALDDTWSELYLVRTDDKVTV